MGATPSIPRTTPMAPALLQEGRGTNRGKATPRPAWPPGHTSGEGGTQAAPPPPRQADPPAARRARRLELPHDPGRTSIHRGMSRRRRGVRAGATGRPPGGGRRGTTARPPLRSPPTPPFRPAGHRSAGPSAPPRQGGRPPLPRGGPRRPRGGRSRARTPRASTPGQPAPTGTATGTRTRAGAQRREHEPQ